MLYYAILYYTLLYYTILYYTTQARHDARPHRGEEDGGRRRQGRRHRLLRLPHKVYIDMYIHICIHCLYISSYINNTMI